MCVGPCHQKGFGVLGSIAVCLDTSPVVCPSLIKCGNVPPDAWSELSSPAVSSYPCLPSSQPCLLSAGQNGQPASLKCQPCGVQVPAPLPASAPAFISNLSSLPAAKFFLRAVILRPEAAPSPLSLPPSLRNQPRTAGQTFRLLLLQYSHLHT